MAKKYLNLPTSEINKRLSEVPEMIVTLEQLKNLSGDVNKKQDKEPNKGLSTNDYTTDDKEKVTKVNVKDIVIENDTLKVTLFDGRTLDFKGGEGIKYVVKKTNDDNTIEVFFLLTDDLDVINEWRDAGYDAHADIVKCSYVANNGGGGGGGTTSDYTMEARITRQPNDAMVMGSENILSFSYLVYYGNDKTDIETGNGKSQVFINGAHVPDLDLKLKSNEDGTPREYTINLGEYLTSAENTVELRVQNADGTLTRQWVWNIAAYSLTVSFAESYLVSQTETKPASWNLPIRVVGSNGILHVKVDNVELPTVQVQAGSTTNVRIDADAELSEGAHSIEAWCENDTFGFESDHIFTGFVKAGSTAAVVVAANAPRQATQYGAITVPYYAYLPSTPVGTEISIYIAIISGGKTIATNEQKAVVGEGNLTDILYANVSLMSSELADNATMVIAIDDVQTQHTFAVLQSDVELKQASECKVYYNFLGKSNADADINNLTSSYEGELTSRFVREWALNDNNGCDGEGFRIPINKFVTLDLVKKFFAKDFGANGLMTGATFAIELKTNDIVDTDAIVVDCMGEDCGFRVYANRIEIKRAGSNDPIVAPFPEQERVRVGFVIDDRTTHCEADTGQGSKIEKDYNLGYIYVDGCVTRLFEYGNDSWKQETPKDIIIGSADSAATIYTIRVYDKALTVTEWLNTYAFDTPDVNDKIDIATRNAILDSTGEVSMALIQKHLPHTAIHVWEMEEIPATKRDTKNITYSSFTNPDWDGETLAQASYEAGKHTCKADGTSSEGYPLPFKNLGETLDGITVKYITGDEHSEVYSLTEGTVGEKDFVDKINFASSEGILNICAMNMYQKILLNCAKGNNNLLTKQQLRQYENDGNITFRQSLSGLPEIGFRRYTEGGKKVTKYWSLFNLINNKYSGTLFGLETKTGKDLVDGKQAELWEVDENVNFFNQEFTDNSVDGDGNLVPSTGVNDVDGYTTLYYCRVPKKSAVNNENGYGVAVNSTQVAQANSEISNLQRFHNWIVSLNPWLAEQYKVAYGDGIRYRQLETPWIASDGTPYPYFNPSYCKRRFLEEYQHYLNSDSACFYFVFCTWIIGMDSMDKNMTIAFDDVTVPEPKASFMLRDTDTWGRFNNTGRLVYPYYAEWGDTYKASTGEIGRINGVTADGKATSDLEGSTQIFNGAMSGLWALVSTALEDKVKSTYQKMRSGGLNDKEMLDMWESFRSKWCDALYNYDSVKRYASTGNLDMAYGDKWALMRDFFVKRTRYMDAKYKNCSTDNKTVMRFNDVPKGVWIENSQPTYASFEFGANNYVNKRNINNETIFLDTPATIKELRNATCYIDDADLVTGFGGIVIDQYGNKQKGGIEALGQVAFTQSDLSNLSKVKEFVMAYTAQTPNTYQQAEDFGAFSELKNFTRLRRLIMTYVQGYKGVVECNSEYLEEIDLSGTECSGIVLNACKSGCRIALPSTAGSITINSAGVDSYSIFKSIYDNGGSVNRISVANDINWTNASVNVILMLAKAKSINLRGTIQITDDVDANAKIAMVEAFGDIDNEQNALRIVYERVVDEPTMLIFGEGYISKTGSYKYNINLVPKTYNGLKGLSWSLSANAAPYATIDNKGNLNVTSIPADDSEMVLNREMITLTANMVRHDGDIQSQTFNVGLFRRMEKVTLNIRYGSNVTSRAKNVFVSFDGSDNVTYPVVDDVVTFLVPYNVNVVITFPEFEDASTPRTQTFTTGRDERDINVIYPDIVLGFAWMMKDGTEEPIGAVDASRSNNVFGLIVNTDEYDIAPFIVPVRGLIGELYESVFGGTYDYVCLQNRTSHANAMADKDGAKMMKDVLEENKELCLIANSCIDQYGRFTINNNRVYAFIPAYAQMYFLVQNYSQINDFVIDVFGTECKIRSAARWATMSENSSNYYVNIYYGGYANSQKQQNASTMLPLIQYPIE